jgi:PPOX class probable F420-dependent enzyme
MAAPGETLTPAAMRLLADARRAVLVTIRADGTGRLVPLAFAADPDSTPLVIYSSLDEKPKSVADMHDLARVRDITARPRVGLLVDRWSEDWRDLEWLRLDGTARLLEPDADGDSAEHARAVELLRARYPQYSSQRLEGRPVLRIAVERVASWSAST